MGNGEAAGRFVGNMISGLFEMAALEAERRRQQRRLAYKRSAYPLPPRAKEACERAVYNALCRLPDGLANALYEPALKLCTELLLHESSVSNRKSAAAKYTDILTMLVYWLLHDPERRLWLPQELIAVNEDELPQITVSLDTLHAGLPQAIESIGAILRRNCTADGEPLPGLWHKYRVNEELASGINPADPRTSRKQPVLPTQANGKTPRELIHSYLGGTPFPEFFTTTLPVSFPLKARFEHLHVVGGSGHGKTQLLQTLMLPDLNRVRDGKASLIVIDSQGDMLKNLLRLFSVAEIAERVVLIEPHDIDYPPALNLFDFGLDRLERYSGVEREKLINGAIALYEYVFGALLGAELTQRQGVIFRYLARLMMNVRGATIHTLMDFMYEPESTRPHLSKLDPVARRFFETQFFSKAFDDTRQQILTRLWGVVSNSVLERMFASPRNKVNLFEAMNRGSLILINTAKDLLKQQGCEILGRFFIALISQAAQERAAISEDRRTPTFVYIDEAHDYFDESMEALFNQLRKYLVSLTIAHQNLDQFEQKLRATVMSSTSIKMVGGLSARDASAFAKEMRCEPEFFAGIRKHEQFTEFACMVRNHTPRPIRISIPFGQMEGQPRSSARARAALIAQNRARYCADGNDNPPEPDISPDDDSPLGDPELL
jgi:hypothetical protein